MPKALSLEIMWQAKQLYEEKWTEEDAKHSKVRAGERKWSMRTIAAKLGISETSVLRAVTNTGRFAVLANTALPEVKSDAILQAEAEASMKRFAEKIAAEQAEQTPGKTKADQMLAEIDARTDLSEEAKARLKAIL